MRYNHAMRGFRSRRLAAVFLAAAPALLSGCSSLSGESVSVLFAPLAFLGACAGAASSTFVWSADDAGSWTPWWEVALWFISIPFGAFAGAARALFPLSSLAISFASSFVFMMPVALFVHFLKKSRED